MTDRELIANALSQWRNHIQTGETTLSSDTALKMGWSHKCRVIDHEEREFIIRIEELRKVVLSGYRIK